MTRWLRWWMSWLPRRTPNAGPRLIVLRHHRLYEAEVRPLYRLGVSTAVFERQLDLLTALDLVPLTVSDGLDWLCKADGGTRVALTFDDGYRDNLTLALPLLERRGARATFYLAAGLIEQRLAPWWDRIAHRVQQARAARLEWSSDGRALSLPLHSVAARRAAVARLMPLFRVAPEVQERRLQDLSDALRATGEPASELATWHELAALAPRGMEVGAHTLTHPFLSRLSPERQDAEIGGSVELIRARLGVDCAGLAFPGGDYDAASVAACVHHGLRYAVTTRRGDVRRGLEPFELPRRGLPEGACLDPLGHFSPTMARAELSGAFDGWRRVVEVAS